METNKLGYSKNMNNSRTPIRIIHKPTPIQILYFLSGRLKFISRHAPLSRLKRNLQRVILKQIASFESARESIVEETHQLPRILFSSLPLSRKKIYLWILALKYAKVGNILMEVGITW